MGKINWSRVFLGGLLAGVVMLALGALGSYLPPRRDFLAALEALGHPLQLTLGLAVAWIFVTFGSGTVAVWLYAAIRPRFGPGPKTAAIAGCTVWLILSLADVFWLSLGLVPIRPSVIGVAFYLVIFPVATILGAWPYKEP